MYVRAHKINIKTNQLLPLYITEQTDFEVRLKEKKNLDLIFNALFPVVCVCVCEHAYTYMHMHMHVVVFIGENQSNSNRK